MGKTTFKPYLKKKNSKDTHGYITLLVIKDRVIKGFSTGERIPKNMWNEKQHTIETMLRVNRSVMSEERRREIINKFEELRKQKEFQFRENETSDEVQPLNKNLSYLNHLEL